MTIESHEFHMKFTWMKRTLAWISNEKISYEIHVNINGAHVIMWYTVSSTPKKITMKWISHNISCENENVICTWNSHNLTVRVMVWLIVLRALICAVPIYDLVLGINISCLIAGCL